jgi:CubicO group peptidase (beta-lactamase class C family)
VNSVRDGHTLEELLVATRTDAFVVLHGSELAVEWYGADDVAESPQILMSITRSFVGGVTGTLAARGVVDVEAPVVQYVPELAAGGYGAARVRDVLDMRTGAGSSSRTSTTPMARWPTSHAPWSTRTRRPHFWP